VCGVCAIAVPVLLGVLTGERPHALAWVGVVMAVAAVVLLGQAEESSPGEAREAGLRPVLFAVLAGVAVGLFFAVLQRTSKQAGVWPLVASRIVSLALVGSLAIVRRQAFGSVRPTVRLVVGSGVIDTLANVVYLFAVREGLLSIVATLASLYPAGTILCARVVLGEHITRVQMVGLLIALAAAAMIGLG
jgi:drug/metabolite transporter (DMT)-like permease